MKELKAVLEGVVLNDATKEQLVEAVKVIKDQALEEAKKELEIEYAEKLVNEKTALAAKLPELVNEAVKDEIGNLQDEINFYKSLDVKYAERYEQYKEQYRAEMQTKVAGLVEGVVKSEVAELKESIVEAKRNIIGNRIFEAVLKNAEEFGINADEKALRDELDAAKSQIAESKKTIAEFERKDILEGLLSNLKGKKRDVMESILEGVQTEKLEARYNEVLNRVLGESEEKKDSTPINEGATHVNSDDDDMNDILKLAGIK